MSCASDGLWQRFSSLPRVYVYSPTGALLWALTACFAAPTEIEVLGPSLTYGTTLAAFVAQALSICRRARLQSPTVDSAYVAYKLNCSRRWVAIMVTKGEIPRTCLTAPVARGMPLQFSHSSIDRWIRGQP